MDKFLKKYNGHLFEDEHSVCSRDFKRFAAGFKEYLKRNLPSSFSIKEHSCGHYDLSGFVEAGGKYVYYSWSWDRFSPLDVKECCGCRRGLLYRTAMNTADYTGGYNNFCSLEEAPEKIGRLIVSQILDAAKREE